MKLSDHLLPVSMLLGLVLPAQGQSDELLPIQGATFGGKVSKVADDTVWVQVPGEEEPRKIAIGLLRSIRLGGHGSARVGASGFIRLRSGILLPATIDGCRSDEVTFSSPVLTAPVTVPVRFVQAMRFAKTPVDEDRGFARYAEQPKEDKDLIYARTGDKVIQRTITIDRFEKGKLVFELLGETREVELNQLYGLVMSEISGTLPDPQPRPRVALDLRIGNTISGKLISLDAGTCVVRLDEKVELKLRRDAVSAIRVLSDRLVYLSDLTPAKVAQTPAFSRRWPWHKNKAPGGEGIQLGGKEYKNGLVLIPRTKLTYRLDGSFDFFEAVIGIEDRSKGPAHAIFRVRSGDKVLYESKPLTRQSEPVNLKVPIKNVGRLTIEADFGKNYDFGDHCAFVEARLIKQGS